MPAFEDRPKFGWCFSHGRLHDFPMDYPPGVFCTARWVPLAGVTKAEAMADKQARFGDAQFIEELPAGVQGRVIAMARERKGGQR